MFRKKEKLGDIIVRKGYATREKVEEALARQAEQIDKGMKPQKLGEMLEEMGIVTRGQIESVLDEQKKFLLGSWLYSIFNIKH